MAKSDIKKRFPSLSWLWISMSYHRHKNLRELLQGDLNQKLIANVTSRDYVDEPCNCRNPSSCPYKGRCRNKVAIYKATCLTTNKVYIGNTARNVKTRIQEHVRETKDQAQKKGVYDLPHSTQHRTQPNERLYPDED